MQQMANRVWVNQQLKILTPYFFKTQKDKYIILNTLQEGSKMSKLACRCGYVMAVHTMEEDFLYDLVPQKNVMEIVSMWDQIRFNEYPDGLTELYDKSTREIYICPSCGRMAVQQNEDKNIFDFYKKETE